MDTLFGFEENVTCLVPCTCWKSCSIINEVRWDGCQCPWYLIRAPWHTAAKSHGKDAEVAWGRCNCPWYLHTSINALPWYLHRLTNTLPWSFSTGAWHTAAMAHGRVQQSMVPARIDHRTPMVLYEKPMAYCSYGPWDRCNSPWYLHTLTNTLPWYYMTSPWHTATVAHGTGATVHGTCIH
jgi:hypothetical protein